jgi:SAM-dependent methyltransferase
MASLPLAPARERFLALLAAGVGDGKLLKLTLGKYRGTDPSLRNVFVRPVALKSGPHLSFLWRHATRDVTKNLPPEAALSELGRLLGADFLDAHLFTSESTAQLETQPDGSARLRVKNVARPEAAPPAAHDRAKTHVISPDAPWLRDLGVINERGQPRQGMADKFRQIHHFADLLRHLLVEAFPAAAGPGTSGAPLRIVDVGSGKGYLTFATAELMGERASVVGVEARAELVALCNRVAQRNGLAPRMAFQAGWIAEAPLEGCDALIALHACDTATDDALARGIAAGATLLVVAPCCQKELRPQLTPPAVMAEPLRHGIFQERQAEFVTDALRAMLLEWAGYRTKVFEFISTEHTAKNLMIAGIRTLAPGARDDAMAERVRAFAGFYGIRQQQLAAALAFQLAGL